MKFKIQTEIQGEELHKEKIMFISYGGESLFKAVFYSVVVIFFNKSKFVAIEVCK